MRRHSGTIEPPSCCKEHIVAALVVFVTFWKYDNNKNNNNNNNNSNTTTTTTNNNNNSNTNPNATTNRQVDKSTSPGASFRIVEQAQTNSPQSVSEEQRLSKNYSSFPWLYPGEQIIYQVNHVAYIKSKYFVEHEHFHTNPQFKLCNASTVADTGTTSATKATRNKRSNSEKKRKNSDNQPRRIIHGNLYITNFQIRFIQERFDDDDSDDEDSIGTFSPSIPLASILTLEEKLSNESSAFRNYYSQISGNNDDTNQDTFFSPSALGVHHNHMVRLNNGSADKDGQVDRSGEEDCSSILKIYGKTLNSMKLAFFRNSCSKSKKGSEISWSAQLAIKELNYLLNNLKVPKNLFAFQFGEQRDQHRKLMKFFTEKQMCNGWNIYNVKQDFARQGLKFDENPHWRLTEVNINYQICDSYPAQFVVPKSITDDQLRACALFRSKGRIPALSWIHPSPNNGGCIIRCSQPMVGFMRSRSREDEELIEAILKTTPAQRAHIIDCRPKANALAQTMMGRGYEDVTYYNNCSIEFMGIDNIHAMHSSLQTLTKLCQKQGDVYWLSNLENTGWLRHCRLILQCAQKIVEMVELKGMAVIVHCSDGWDRTTQVSSLAQLLLDPYYRTIRGFESLIEKEWCSFGHKFCDRLGHIRNPNLTDEISPVFVQFIDCVWQILQQFPENFEFNETFLITILDHSHSCLFGNFLHNCEKEREMDGVKQNTISLWTYINSNKQRFTNALYKKELERKSRRVLILDCAIETLCLHFWVGYFYRYRMGMKARYQKIQSQIFNIYHIENAQIKRTLANETRQREQIEKELQECKHKINRLNECLKWFEQTGTSAIFSEEKGNDVVMLTKFAGAGNMAKTDASDEDDDGESIMKKSIRLMENYFK